MAGNEKSGRATAFPLTAEQLKAHIDKYKADVETGKIARASWPHFAASLDCTEADLAKIMAIDEQGQSAYINHGRLLKKMATWCRGQLMSAPGWNGQMTARAIFSLKQDVGDGVVYRDRDNGSSAPSTVKVEFGGDDPRGKKACK
jgi:hypothetical protein